MKSEAAQTTSVFLTYLGSVVTVRNIVILQCFDAVDWVTGRASGLKKFRHNNSQKFAFGDRPDPE